MEVTKFPKESYVFMVDSSNRNKSIYPNSNQYTIEFNTPFHNVIAFEVLRCHLQRSEYNIDEANNTFEYKCEYKMESENCVKDGLVRTITIPPGDYNLPRLIGYLNEHLTGGITIQATTIPYNLSDKVTFTRDACNDNTFHIIPNPCSLALGFHSMLTSHDTGDGVHELTSDGRVDLTGYNNIVFIRCKEIEQLVFRERFNEQHIHSGMGYVRLASTSTNEETLNFYEPFPARELALPLPRLKRISFALETTRGELYNTRGLNHQIVCRVTYHKPPRGHE
jgi:hypothetical protein